MPSSGIERNEPIEKVQGPTQVAERGPRGRAPGPLHQNSATLRKRTLWLSGLVHILEHQRQCAEL